MKSWVLWRAMQTQARHCNCCCVRPVPQRLRVAAISHVASVTLGSRASLLQSAMALLTRGHCCLPLLLWVVVVAQGLRVGAQRAASALVVVQQRARLPRPSLTLAAVVPRGCRDSLCTPLVPASLRRSCCMQMHPSLRSFYRQHLWAASCSCLSTPRRTLWCSAVSQVRAGTAQQRCSYYQSSRLMWQRSLLHDARVLCDTLCSLQQL